MCSCLSDNSAQLVGKEILKTASIPQRYRSSCHLEKTVISENYDSIQMSNEQRFVLFDNAKLRREFEENKKTVEILMKLYRQKPK